MTLTPDELFAVATEIARELGGRRVQKVVQPGERTLLIGFSRRWLRIDLDRRFGRLHLCDDKPPGDGEAAPAFCMLLRKELVGTQLSSVEPVIGERACGFEFTRDGERRRLLVFLYGAGARAVLVDEAGRKRGQTPAAAQRDDQPREDLVELPPPKAVAPAATGHEENDGSDERRGAPELPAARASRFSGDDLSSQIAAHYAAEVLRSDEEQARTTARAAARRDLAKVARLEEALQRDLDRVAATADRRRHADLLLAHLHEVPRGASSVTLPDDFGGGAPVTIPLDPRRSARDNAVKLYEEHKRLVRGRAAVEKRLAEARVERARAEARVAFVESSPVAALASPVGKPQPARSKKHKTDGPRPPYRVFRSGSGVDILVGKGAEKNDQLTFRVAKGNDLWLHARDLPGAHVVVPLGGRPVDEVTLLDAATLALHFSPARDESEGGAAPSADVQYALRKLVRKPKNAGPGRVSVAGGKTLRVRLEPERLKRLLATRADDE